MNNRYKQMRRAIKLVSASYEQWVKMFTERIVFERRHWAFAGMEVDGNGNRRTDSSGERNQGIYDSGKPLIGDWMESECQE